MGKAFRCERNESVSSTDCHPILRGRPSVGSPVSYAGFSEFNSRPRYFIKSTNVTIYENVALVDSVKIIPKYTARRYIESVEVLMRLNK